MSPRFMRLLGDCERLTRYETVALCQNDIETAGPIQADRSVILDELTALAEGTPAEHMNGGVSARIQELILAMESNARMLSRLISQAQQEHKKLQSTLNRLHSFRAVYRQDSHAAPGSFFARG